MSLGSSQARSRIQRCSWTSSRLAITLQCREDSRVRTRGIEGMLMSRSILHRLPVAMCLVLGTVVPSTALLKAQTDGVPKSVDITVQVLDGRNGKPIPNQRVLVFGGGSSEAAKSHAEHSDLTTDKDGFGTLKVYPDQTQWVQVWADGRVPCYPDPNQSSFRIDTIMSAGVVAPNSCSDVVKGPVPRHLIVFARPARFMEKMKR